MPKASSEIAALPVSYRCPMGGQVGDEEHTTPSEFTSANVTVRLLGPIEIEVNGTERVVPGRRQRSVMAFLAMNAGQPVSADRLLDEIWTDNVPDTGIKAVAFQVSKLRSLLEPDRVGEGSLILTTPAGYVLKTGTGVIDVREFDSLINAARGVLATDPRRCQKLLEKALTLWRGRPFADLGDEPFVDPEGRRLEQTHLLARRTMAEARLAQGGDADVVAELEALVAEQPLEEGVVQLLMMALHRSGRTSDALRSYADLRLRLGSELGIEPSGQLKRLEQQFLAGDDDSSVIVETTGSAPESRGNLPTPVSSFVGRTEEINEISELLSTTRLVSLVSFGGLGKTRLAIEVASSLGGTFDDGVWFLDLIPIADERQLADEFVVATGLHNSLDVEPVEYLLSNPSST